MISEMFLLELWEMNQILWSMQKKDFGNTILHILIKKLCKDSSSTLSTGTIIEGYLALRTWVSIKERGEIISSSPWI